MAIHGTIREKRNPRTVLRRCLALTLLIGVTAAGAALGQVPASPNRLDKKGERTGEWTMWFNAGMEPVGTPDSAVYYSVMTFKNGKPEGTARSFFRSGKPMSETRFVDGLREGTVKGWYESGAKEFETPYRKGLAHGRETVWYPDGSKRGEVMYENGREHGVNTEWYPDGKKKSEIPFVHGVVSGTARRWYPTGAPRGEMNFVKGVKQGEAKDWDEKGTLTVTAWKDGKKVK